MRIEKLQWKNIFSYGNKTETLDFGSEGKLWQICGKSGHGKTALLTIPKLLLYGKTEGSEGKPIKVTAIANRINKGGWIRGEIKEGNDFYVVERTFSPQSLKVWKNGNDLDKAGLKDMQGIIDSEILDNMPYHIFANVMIVSLNNFKSFISMNPADKRQIIDKIFNLEIVNKVYEMIKKDMKDVGNAINTANSQMYAYEQTINSSNAELVNLDQRSKTDNTTRINELNAKLSKVAEIYKVQVDAYNICMNKCNELSTAERTAYNRMYDCNNECKKIQDKLALFNESKCPTCGTPFTGDVFDEIRNKLNTEYQEKINEYNLAKTAYDGAVKAKNDANVLWSQAKINVDKVVAKQNEFLYELRSLEQATTKDGEYQSIQKIIGDAIANKKVIEDSMQISQDQMSLLAIMEKMYSADGIKQRLMENYIPTLNEEIRHTLNVLDFPYTLEFDGNFDPHLEALGEPIEPQSLSIGEHKKVDLTVLCAILQMIKKKYPQNNLICLDETLSSLDYESSTDILTYLKDMANEMKLNIFVTSHTMLEETLFDERLLVEKKQGFSELIRM